MAIKKRAKFGKVVLAYLTTPNQKEALAIGQFLIRKKLAACVNIIPNMTSAFRWKGKIQKASETVVILKTTRSKQETIVKEVQRLHSYEVPCILFFETSGGNQDYMDWLHKECS